MADKWIKKPYGSGRWISRRKRRGGYIAKPSAFRQTRYDGDAWIKVQVHTELSVQTLAGGIGRGYLQARTDSATSTFPDYSYLDQPEYQVLFNQYQYAEVRGLKVEVTPAQITRGNAFAFNLCRIYSGPARDVPTGALPALGRLNGLPVQVPVAVNGGQAVSCYFNVNRAIRNAGQPQSTQTNVAYPSDYGYSMVVYAEANSTAGLSVGDVLGSVVFTYYIRLHQRKYVA